LPASFLKSRRRDSETLGRMFKEADGATALRPDLVHTLAVSIAVHDIEGEPSCAATAAVWNGRKGYVAVVVRGLRSGAVTRFVYDGSLKSIEKLEEAAAAGMQYAESLGFCMDAGEFAALDAAQQAERIDLWDDVRKRKRYPRHLPPLDEQAAGAAPPAQTAPPESASAKSSDDADEAADSKSGRAVLGQIEIVRHPSTREGWLDPIGRVLQHF
jgi:hypothetical protein